MKAGIFSANSMVSGPTTFPDSRLRIPNQPVLDSQLAVACVDEDRRPGRFLLTGSANLLTVKTIHESLAGRVEIVPLYPLGRSEQLGIKHPQFIAKAFRGAGPDTAEALSKEKLSDWVTAG